MIGDSFENVNQEYYLRLCKKAEDANAAYYDQDSPIMEDPEYDTLMCLIKDIEKAHPEWVTPSSPTQHVGGSAGKSSFTKVEHLIPMKSLQDVFDLDEVDDFMRDKEYPVLVEEKIDGLSMSVTYKNGVLVRAETRGNGFIGEDITENAKKICDIPVNLDPEDELTEIPEELEVRCEVYLPINEYLRLNEEKRAANKPEFANPRNAASGILRTKDVSVVENAHLHAFAFNVQRAVWKNAEHPGFGDSHADSLIYLRSVGFNTVNCFRARSNGTLHKIITDIGESRNTLSYWIDGAVVKVDKLSERGKLGETEKYPHWAIAFKYPPEEKETKIKDIVLQTGRTGRVTPVAIFDPPVLLAGTKVQRATLNNPEFIQNLGIMIDDTVLVRKAAEIIPEVICVVKKGKYGRGVTFDMLRCKCPSCGAELVQSGNTDGTELKGAYCPNLSCPAQKARSFEFFASRECMDIRGLGPAQIDKFIELGWLNILPDIYKLYEHKDEMVSLDGFGSKATTNLLSAIEKSKEQNIDRLIKAFGIPDVGRHIGKALCEKYEDLSQISNATEEELLNINGIGAIAAHNIVSFFDDDANREMLDRFYEAGVNMVSLHFNNSPVGNVFSGKTFVITGTLSQPREHFVTLIEANGGKVSGSVSKKTDYLLCGDAAGSKLDKARALGTTILSESDFMALLV